MLTAIEDFVAGREGLDLAVVQAFFGFGVVWPAGADWAPRLRELLGCLDRNPVIERLEGNRMVHLLAREAADAQAAASERLRELEAELRPALDSRAFAFAERLSRLGGGAISRARLRRILDRD